MIQFNSNNLESAYLLINKLNKSDIPTREIQNENLSFQDGFKTLSNFWRSRTIVIGGTIDASSSAHLASLLDTLKKNLSGVDKNLDVDYGASTRRFKGTLARFEAPEEFYNITHLPYSAEFICQPFGYGTSDVSFASNDITAASKNETMTIQGTYKPNPIITLTFGTSASASSVVVTNNTTGDAITITTAMVDGDVLIINTETKKITLNGIQIDFTGPIPEFAIDDNSLTIDMSGSVIKYDLLISYTPLYL